MSAVRHNVHLSVTLMAPFLVHGNDPGRFGLDAVLLRDHLDRIVVPGTLLVGRILDAWKRISPPPPGVALPSYDPILPFPRKGRTTMASEWLGMPTFSGKAPYETSSRLIERDLLLTKIDGKPIDPRLSSIDTTNRIRIDDTTESVQASMLAFIEQVTRAKARLTFESTWSVYASAVELVDFLASLRAGLSWQSQLGAQRTVGFGRLLEASVDAIAPPVAQPVLLPAGSKFRLALQIDEPICIATRQYRGNLFESADSIPGAALLGAMARVLRLRYGVADLQEAPAESALCRHFNRLRATFALPSCDGMHRARPVAQSFILALDSDDDAQPVKDAALCKGPVLAGNGRAPDFSIDWKDVVHKVVRRYRNWDQLSTHLRIRTAVDGERRRAADEKLFAYEMRYAKSPTRWLCDLHVPTDIPEADAASLRKELADMLGAGLDFIGKTKAHAAVKVIDERDVWPSRPVAIDGKWMVLTLVSPACLCTVAQAKDQPLIDVYRAAFSSLTSPLGMRLSHFFARQRLAGGHYLHQRFGAGKHYQPFLLTEAGSVFVFEVEEAKQAESVARKWLNAGLGVPQAVRDAFGADWRSNPYIPQNGYGEVAINMDHSLPYLAVQQEAA